MLGSLYVSTWIAAAGSILGGLVIQVVINHTYNFPICKLKTNNLDELIIFDIFNIAGSLLMIFYYFFMEKKSRFDFFTTQLEIEFQGGYRKLLKNLPIGVILLSKDNNPLFYNRLIGNIIVKKTGKLASRSPSFETEDQQKVKKEVK